MSLYSPQAAGFCPAAGQLLCWFMKGEKSALVARLHPADLHTDVARWTFELERVGHQTVEILIPPPQRPLHLARRRATTMAIGIGWLDVGG